MLHRSALSTRTCLVAVLVSAALATAPAAEAKNRHHNDKAGAAIVGGIAGLVIGAAIADSASRHRDDYPPQYRPYPQPYPVYYPAYRPRYDRPFSPAPGVVCEPRDGLCYDDNGSLAKRWTNRIFGY